MVWVGSPFAHLIEFSSGLPTGAVSYQLLGNDGASVVTSGSVYYEQGALSTLLVIDGAHNTCALPLFENRTLTYNYLTDRGVVADRFTYRVDKPLPLAVSTDGVRNKLGISEHEIPDEQVDLIAAYAEFGNMVGTDTLEAAALTGDRTTILCAKAVEAMAALSILPTLQMRAAQSETSGTNQFARFGSMDWAIIEVDLLGAVARARQVLDANFDAYADSVAVFQTAPPETDAITSDTN